MRRTTLALSLMLALVGCGESNPTPGSSSGNEAERGADASTYNPETRLADASDATSDGDTSGGWSVTDRSLTALPTDVDAERPVTSGDAAVQPYEYPNAHFDKRVDMAGMRVYYYRTADDFDAVTRAYAALPGFTGGPHAEDAATFARTPDRGPTITITVTAQPTAGCQIVINATE